MPASPSISKQMLYSSDYPADKAVWVTEGSVTMGPGVNADIPHGLPFIPLVSFVWSLTSDFAVTYDENVGPFPSGNIGYFFSLQVASEATATNVTLRGNGTAANTTIYYRIFAFEPTTSTATVVRTSNEADAFKLNTDYNVPKLYMSGTVTVASGSTTSINHNLGYRPQVALWYSFSPGTTVFPMCYFSVNTSAPNAQVDTAQIIFKGDFLSSYTAHYRVYLDE